MPPADEGGGAELEGPDSAAGGPQVSTQLQSRKQTFLLQSQVPETNVVGKPETKGRCR